MQIVYVNRTSLSRDKQTVLKAQNFISIDLRRNHSSVEMPLSGMEKLGYQLKMR